MNKLLLFLTSGLFIFSSCQEANNPYPATNPQLRLVSTPLDEPTISISRNEYLDHLYGFWLGQSIANWTGLITEMDKIGNMGDIKTGDFYTRNDWGQPDQPSIWAEGVPSDLSPTIGFIFADKDSIWGSDDDTDIEYIYQELLLNNKTSVLTPKQISDGWMKHIHQEEENYLWVSNQKAFDLMLEGYLPPATSDPSINEHYDMIDAQLTTEIFGLYAPGYSSKSLEMAYLPIRTTASKEAAEIAEFYVRMYNSLTVDTKSDLKIAASESRKAMNNDSYPAKMYYFILSQYEQQIPWEAVRDAVYQRYQVEQKDGYDVSSRDLYCNGCFAAGINYAASLISLFYGEGSFSETVKIAVLCGWDSDNPAATWGGLLGFRLGKTGLEKEFGRTFSGLFNIHRTRKGCDNEGIDTFENMALKGLWVIDRVVQEELNGKVDQTGSYWYLPEPITKLN